MAKAVAVVGAFFDVDGTLCTGQLWKGLGRYCRTFKTRRFHYYSFLASHIGFLWPLYRFRLISDERFFARWGSDLAGMFRGMKAEEVEAVLRWVVQEELAPTLRPDTTERLRWHRDQGHTVVLISGVFREALELLAEHLGECRIVATGLASRNGRITGRMDGAFCYWQEKARRLRDFAESTGLDPAQSYAYADRRYDVPMLEQVGHPIAVSPDQWLLDHAKSHGWTILGEPKETPAKAR